MTSFAIRPATAADLPTIHDIFYESEIDGVTNPPPLGSIPVNFPHIFQTGEMFVAEEAGQVIGFGSRIKRGRVSFLADLFVRKSCQSIGVGQALLDRTMPRDGTVRATASSTDYRAQSLYTRSGMLPRWPYYLMAAGPEGLKALPPHSVEVVEAEAGDPALLQWDTRVSGMDRAPEHAYWVEATQGTPIWFQRGGKRIGYGYIRQSNTEDPYWYSDAVILGPLGTDQPDAAVDCAFAAVEWAGRLNRRLRINVPAPHPALAPLLTAGFRIAYVCTFMLEGEPFFDSRCYIPSGDTLF